MLPIRALVEIVLLLAQVIVEALRQAPDFRTLELRVFQAVQEAARRLFVVACEQLDEQACKQRNRRELRALGRRVKSVLTWFGEVRLPRRYYRDFQSGKGRFLLDELLGLPARQRLSPLVVERGAALAVEMPFRAAAAQLRALTCGAVDVSAMELWSAVQASGNRAKEEAEARRRSLFEDGEVPPGNVEPQELDVEVDEVLVAARVPKKGQRAKLGVKLAVGYEGKEPVGKGRRRLVRRRVHAAVREAEAFFEETVADFGHVWELSAVHSCTLGSDGAAWAKKGLEYFPRALFRLDPFHLRRALRRGLGHDEEAHAQVAAAIAEGRPWEEVTAVLEAAAQRAGGDRRRRIEELRGYLRANWAGIVAHQKARALGTIEGQVYHVVARRMKRRGARWSERGADHLARLLAARANGELERFLRREGKRDGQRCASLLPEQAVRPATARERTDLEEWLRARIPALYGPHAGRPWIKHLLRQLAHVGPVA